MQFSCRVYATIQAPRERAFALIAPIDLTRVFRGFGPLPAIIGVENQSGDRNEVGQTRNPILSDGSAASEKLTAYDAPARFGYTIDGLTGPLRFLVERAQCQWRFEAKSEGATRVKWEYKFFARSIVAVPALLVVVALWRLYMRQVLGEMKVIVETRD